MIEDLPEFRPTVPVFTVHHRLMNKWQFIGSKSSNLLISMMLPPFHGGNTGSNPVRVAYLILMGIAFWFQQVK